MVEELKSVLAAKQANAVLKDSKKTDADSEKSPRTFHKDGHGLADQSQAKNEPEVSNQTSLPASSLGEEKQLTKNGEENSDKADDQPAVLGSLLQSGKHNVKNSGACLEKSGSAALSLPSTAQLATSGPRSLDSDTADKQPAICVFPHDEEKSSAEKNEHNEAEVRTRTASNSFLEEKGGAALPTPSMSQLALAAALRARTSMPIAAEEFGSESESEEVCD